MKVFKNFFSLFLIFIFLISCNKNQKIFIENDIFIEIPNDLKSCKTLNENAFLQFQNTEDELYLIVLKENKKEVFKTLNLNNQLDSKENLNEYLNKIKQNYPLVKEFHTLKEFKQDIKHLEFSIQNNFLSNYYHLIVFENEVFYFQIYIWTIEEFKNQNHSKIIEILKSISK